MNALKANQLHERIKEMNDNIKESMIEINGDYVMLMFQDRCVAKLPKNSNTLRIPDAATFIKYMLQAKG